MRLCDKYPFLTEYFKSSLNSDTRSISHSILFYGNDVQAQYDLAIFIAKLLNCKGDKTEECNCLNCRWITEAQHPAVLTLSRFDNKPLDDTSKTVISIKQAQFVKNSLLINSEYYRVFIFCDKTENGDILGLNEKNFQAETANALLKTIEEPPSNTIFFFLTKDKADIISTIISRSQCFFVPSFERNNFEHDLILPIMENYFEFPRKDAFDVALKLINFSGEVPVSKVLEQLQNYIFSILKSNMHNKKVQNKLIDDLKAVEEAKKQSLLGIKPVNVFEKLCLTIIG